MKKDFIVRDMKTLKKKMIGVYNIEIYISYNFAKQIQNMRIDEYEILKEELKARRIKLIIEGE